MERKPGRPRALTIDAIANAALADGIATFSMPSVARRLGVAHSGLYRYVTDRDDLLVKALDIAFNSTTWPDASLPWDELLREIGESVWRACDAYPGLNRASQMATVPSPVLLSNMEPWIVSINEQHFSMQDAAVAVEFVIALALDSSAGMARMARMERGTMGPRYPVLQVYNTDEVWLGHGMYDRKLDILIAGLATRRTEK